MKRANKGRGVHVEDVTLGGTATGVTALYNDSRPIDYEGVEKVSSELRLDLNQDRTHFGGGSDLLEVHELYSSGLDTLSAAWWYRIRTDISD